MKKTIKLLRLTARSRDSLAESLSISLAYAAGAPGTACWTIARHRDRRSRSLRSPEILRPYCGHFPTGTSEVVVVVVEEKDEDNEDDDEQQKWIEAIAESWLWTDAIEERERVRVEGAGLAGFESSDIVRNGQDRWVVEGCEGSGKALCVCLIEGCFRHFKNNTNIYVLSCLVFFNFWLNLLANRNRRLLVLLLSFLSCGMHFDS